MKKQEEQKQKRSGTSHHHRPNERRNHFPSEAYTSPRTSPNAEKSTRGLNEEQRKASTRPHRRESIILLRAGIAFVAIFSTFLLIRMLLLLVPIRSVSVEYGDGKTGYYTVDEISAVMNYRIGDKLYDSATSKMEEDLLENFPLFEEVSVRRTLGGKLILRVTECRSEFFVNVSGTYYALGRDNYRVLVEEATPDRFYDYGLYEISLPNVRVAFLGKKLEFGEVGQELFLSVLFKELDQSPFADRVTGIRAADRYNISFIIDDKYDVTIGSVSDLDRKLTSLSNMMNSEISQVFKSGKDAVVNISDLKAPTARTVERIDTTIAK